MTLMDTLASRQKQKRKRQSALPSPPAAGVGKQANTMAHEPPPSIIHPTLIIWTRRYTFWALAEWDGAIFSEYFFFLPCLGSPVAGVVVLAPKLCQSLLLQASEGACWGEGTALMQGVHMYHLLMACAQSYSMK